MTRWPPTRNVQRQLFDHEPDQHVGATNLSIHDETGGSGGLGFLQLKPLRSTGMHNISVVEYHLRGGHFIVVAGVGGVTRKTFLFSCNVTDTTQPYAGGCLGRQALIQIGSNAGGWSGVVV